VPQSGGQQLVQGPLSTVGLIGRLFDRVLAERPAGGYDYEQ
jgi:hypothetical protein